MNPAGSQATQIANLWWFYVAVSVVVYVVVIAFLVVALMHRRRVEQSLKAARERADARARLAVGAAIGLSAVTLVVLAISDFVFARSLTRTAEDPVRIKLTGHQWWWEIEYEDPVPSQRLRTANELHVPVGRPVQMSLTSQDVIHSFWIPNLDGKKDLIPGYDSVETFVAEKPGTYMGMCAEFCGYQHVKMRLVLRAESPTEFAAWKAQQSVSCWN